MDEHIGVEIFKALKEYKILSQKELCNLIEGLGFSRNKVFMYVRYILTVPVPIDNDTWSEPMLHREPFSLNNTIMIELNVNWQETEVDAVRKLFQECDPGRF